MARAVTEVTVGAALRCAGVRIFALAADRKWCEAGAGGVYLQAERVPAAVVVVERGGTLRAFSVDGTERDPSVLIDTFPELARAVAESNP
jgi:hypothetical protein